jgi:hypothetical protein
MRSTKQLEPYQFKPWVLKPGDKEKMRQMIRANLNLHPRDQLDLFVEHWHKAGLTTSSARVYFYNLKKTIDNG